MVVSIGFALGFFLGGIVLLIPVIVLFVVSAPNSRRGPKGSRGPAGPPGRSAPPPTPPSPGDLDAVVFDDPQMTTIRSNRQLNQGTVDPTAQGVTQFGSDSTGIVAAATGAYATIGGGDQNVVSGNGAVVAGGTRNQALANNAMVLGGDVNIVEGVGGSAEGLLNHVHVGAQAGHAEGQGTNVFTSTAHAEGTNSSATGTASHAEGFITVTNGDGAHSEGYQTQALAQGAHSEGASSVAGTYGVASAQAAHSEGQDCVASGQGAHAEGNGTQAVSAGAHSEGASSDFGTTGVAQGVAAHSEGQDCVASGQGAHAEGYGTQALNIGAHSEGVSSDLGTTGVAQGIGSHVEGQDCVASGEASHAQGVNTTASGTGSHVEGESTNSNGLVNAHIMGQFGTAIVGPVINPGGSPPITANLTASWQLASGQDVNNQSIGALIYTDTFGPQGLQKAGGLADFWNVGFGADFAEYLEWQDHNQLAEDRVGYFVSIGEHGKLVLAGASDDVIGITSATAGYVADTATTAWQGASLRDAFGRPILHPATTTVVRRKPKLGATATKQAGSPPSQREEGKYIDGILKTETRMVAQKSLLYDPKRPYVPRAARPEWSVVGLLGKIYVRDNGACVVGQRCDCRNGIAVPGSRFFVLARSSPDVVRVLFK